MDNNEKLAKTVIKVCTLPTSFEIILLEKITSATLSTVMGLMKATAY